MKYSKALGFVIAADILSLFIGFTLAGSSGGFMRLISAVCTTGILICFMVSFAVKSADEDKRHERSTGSKTAFTVPLLQGAAASLPAAVSWLLLLVSHTTHAFDFYRWHKLLNAYFLQIFNFINPDASTASLSSGDVLLMLPLVFVPALSFTSAYFFSYAKKN